MTTEKYPMFLQYLSKLTQESTEDIITSVLASLGTHSELGEEWFELQ